MRILKPSVAAVLTSEGVSVEEQENILSSYMISYYSAEARYNAAVANLANLETQRDAALTELDRIRNTVEKLTEEQVIEEEL
jgi:hypothetical protein